MIVSGERVAQFVSRQLGVAFCPPYSCLGIERDGSIVGGAIFNHFEGFDVHISIAGKGWSLGFLKELGRYVFGQLGCERMTAVTASEKVAGFMVRHGGQIEGRLRNHFGRGRDAFIAGVLKDEWRY